MPESCCESAERPPGSGESPAGPSLDTDHALGTLAADGFAYFRDHAHADTGLVADSTRPGSPASIAVVGFALAAYPAAAHRGWMSRDDALQHTLATLRFFEDAPQDESPDAAGHRGFFYHFLDMETGRRAGGCELSTIDTTLLLAGGLAAAAFFDGPDRDEADVRRIAEKLYRAADWNWARDGGLTVTHGWTPEGGFLPHRWRGYDEALILYLMGLGSPTHPLPRESYRAWTSTYDWREAYGTEYLYAGPLFTHQYSHVWIDFRGIRDAFMRAKGIDYFENSRRATLVHREYSIRNPRGFDGYCHCCWGLTASDGPGPAERTIDGRCRLFY
ncbi:MAG: hypothetical protein GWN71_31525, partial [Gammaproteobacteria bacterium]|nr:hypothetical protein [Gemmatimonadota bacterium]NIT86826.1 hypothetical protein [Gemmatimonadota bacterium]NIU77923.1 hypothetical protein [Gammaproteobacteria bacterium]NIX39090.1 hypothetical protein [Gemmatimonadota bacterium]